MANISPLKFAEKLTILNDRTIGLLTRLYNIKKACFDPKLRPKFLYEKAIEGAVKLLLKKFPQSDLKNNQSVFDTVRKQKMEIMKSLSLYYSTFVDVLDLKDHIMELLTKMNMVCRNFDLTLNFELTKTYLDLVTNYCSLMILMSRIDDKKAVLSMYNLCHEMINNCNESSFPRMGQMIVDFENPYKKLNEDLTPINRLIYSGLISLSKIYLHRNIHADVWRGAQMLSLTTNSSQMLYLAQTETINCEFLSIDTMERWIVFLTIACHGVLLNDPIIVGMWQRTLQTSLVVPLFRDEVLNLHNVFIECFEGTKGSSKKISEVKENYNIAIQTSNSIHLERRRFLREALKDLTLLYDDQPGILGPKILFVLIGLCFARDEINWYVRHFKEWPQNTKKQKSQSFVVDRQISELIYYTLKLRTIVEKYDRIVSNYYFKYLKSYDAFVMQECIPEIGNRLAKDDEVRLLSIHASMQENIKPTFETYQDVKFDWFRIQANTSVEKYGINLEDYRKLCILLNTSCWHFELIGNLKQLLMKCSSLDIYAFYQEQLKEQFDEARNSHYFSRYAISFAKLTGDFECLLHEMCPEEHDTLIDRAIRHSTSFLEDIGKRLCTISLSMISEEYDLINQASATRCAELIDITNRAQIGKGNRVPEIVPMPGHESVRISRDQLSYMDKQLSILTDLINAVTSWDSFQVFDSILVPKDYVLRYYDKSLITIFSLKFFVDQEKKIISRPSDLLKFINSELTVLHYVERCLGIDLQRLFTSVLNQESLTIDVYNNETFTSLYIKFYVSSILKKASTGNVHFSTITSTFSSTPDYEGPPPEHYTDPSELMSLATLIGPFGIKNMCDHIMWQCAAQIMELLRLTVQNKQILSEARRVYTHPGKMKEVIEKLGDHDTEMKKKTQQLQANQTIHLFTNRLTIVGILMSFKKMLLSASKIVFRKRLKFLYSCGENILNEFSDEAKVKAHELFSTLVVEENDFSILVNMIEQDYESLNVKDGNEFHLICSLLMVFAAITLPKLSSQNQSMLKVSTHSTSNNINAIPVALDTISNVLFAICGRLDCGDRMKEFLKIISCGLLQIVGSSASEYSPNLRSINVLLEDIVCESKWITFDDLQEVFPHNLISSSYTSCFINEKSSINF
ncbi:Membrane-associated protein Hem [Strongyloides ratti]|uniref:Membrane-associated protein Hem n=1 Tax=Strongyloides ratti TaxID=34506 RepID=A0A090LDF9_STRRB|nr:Membrane-associated protein Hem [Strongyloides ratti]CEF67826.1 Membrane-associated protein Hem [Strongyloides ratti]